MHREKAMEGRGERGVPGSMAAKMMSEMPAKQVVRLRVSGMDKRRAGGLHSCGCLN